jgi:dihydrofolate synthase/folylpolyglutamate synthase
MSARPQGLGAWLAHVEALHPRGSAGIELGLERVEMVSCAARPQRLLPCHPGRWNQRQGLDLRHVGAHSARRRLSRRAVYLAASLRYNERVRIDGVAVDDERLCAAFERVEGARGDCALTYFEFGTLAAWEVFAEVRPDAIVLEVGLGGRLDATNIHAPDCSIVTGIDLDHMDFLGPDRESIGREKAGIFAPARWQSAVIRVRRKA